MRTSSSSRQGRLKEGGYLPSGVIIGCNCTLWDGLRIPLLAIAASRLVLQHRSVNISLTTSHTHDTPSDKLIAAPLGFRFVPIEATLVRGTSMSASIIFQCCIKVAGAKAFIVQARRVARCTRINEHSAVAK